MNPGATLAKESRRLCAILHRDLGASIGRAKWYVAAVVDRIANLEIDKVISQAMVLRSHWARIRSVSRSYLSCSILEWFAITRYYTRQFLNSH